VGPHQDDDLNSVSVGLELSALGIDYPAILIYIIIITGKEALLRTKAEGLKKKMVFMTVDTRDADPEGNETVWCDNKVSHSVNLEQFSHTVPAYGNSNAHLDLLPVMASSLLW